MGDSENGSSGGGAADESAGAQSHDRRSNHPIAVALPIGAWGASFAFDLLSAYGPEGNHHARRSRNAMLFGLAGASVSGVLGLRDLLRFSPGHRAPALGLFHAALNLSAVAFYTLAMLRRGAVAAEGELDADEGSVSAGRAGRVSRPDIAANAAALVVLAASGAAGGLLAQRFDVRPG